MFYSSKLDCLQDGNSLKVWLPWCDRSRMICCALRLLREVKKSGNRGEITVSELAGCPHDVLKLLPFPSRLRSQTRPWLRSRKCSQLLHERIGPGYRVTHGTAQLRKCRRCRQLMMDTLLTFQLGSLVTVADVCIIRLIGLFMLFSTFNCFCFYFRAVLPYDVWCCSSVFWCGCASTCGHGLVMLFVVHNVYN